MADAAAREMTPEEFLEWCLTQDEKWELVKGRPVLKDPVDHPRMMPGATRRHDRVVTNIIIALGQRLRGSECRPTTDDISLRTMAASQVRRPDVTIDCGRGDEDAMEASNPVAVFEVLSPSTRQMDLLRKAVEYQDVSSLQHIVFVEPGQASITAYRRIDGGAWETLELDGQDGVLDLPAVGVELPVAEIYEDVSFETD